MAVNNTPDANSELGKAAASIEEVFKYLEGLPDDKKHAAALDMASNGLATAVPEVNLLKSLGVNIQSPTPVGSPTAQPNPPVTKVAYNNFVDTTFLTTLASSPISSALTAETAAPIAEEFINALTTAFPKSATDTSILNSSLSSINKPAVVNAITGASTNDETITALKSLGDTNISTGGKKRTRKAKKSKKSKKRLPSKKRKARKSMRKH